MDGDGLYLNDDEDYEDETLKVRIITMTNQELTQSPCTVFLGILVSSSDFQHVDCTKLLVSVEYTVLNYKFYTHSLTFNTQVGITSRTSSTQVRRAFLAK